MGLAFWIRRTLTVFALVAAVLFVVRLLRGDAAAAAAEYGALWGALTAGVFTAARVVQSRRGQHCAICQDTPEMADRGA